ncbi:MAG: glucose-6-phosphate dehydrogenase [Bacteroidota bacterium]
MNKPEPHIIVIFGASGDLTFRKLMPALYKLNAQNLMPGNFAILGLGRTRMDDDEFRIKMKEALEKYGGSNNISGSFLDSIYYKSLDYGSDSDYSSLKDTLTRLEQKHSTGENLLFYMATPPRLYEVISQKLADNGLNYAGIKLIVEKPFGNDLHSAQKLNKHLLRYFSEDQIYRIDHYLGKETVQNIMVTRFSNIIFEPLWNRNFISHVEITSAEAIGVEDRGGYYDHSGALRDMVQNHLLQLVGLVAMEPPVNADSESIRGEMLKLFKSLRPLDEKDVYGNVIRGQYLESMANGEKVKSYRDEKGVNRDSKTETFAAIKFYIDNWRWNGVPFYIRTGKRLPSRVTEIVIHFKDTPHHIFCRSDGLPNNLNQLIIRIQPNEGLLMKFGMKVPGAGFSVQTVNMDFLYSSLSDKKLPEAYERLLLDCMLNDSTLYARAEEVEITWEFLNPILKVWQKNDDIPLYGYPAKTWGPDVADNLIEQETLTWRYPCKNLVDDGIYCEL